MLESWMPHLHTSPQNPVFRYGSRRIRWGQTAHALRRYTLWVVGIITALVFLGWGLIVLLMLPASGGCVASSSYLCNYSINQLSVNLIGLLMLGSIAADVLLDFACMLAAFSSIGHDLHSPRWDLLRLTLIHMEKLVSSKYLLAQIRSWRVMVIIIGLRVATVVLIGVYLMIQPSLWRSIGTIQFMDMLIILATSGIFFSVYVVEPYWRMQAVTALGMALVLRLRHIISALLGAMAAVLFLWIAQGMVVAGHFFLMSVFAPRNGSYVLFFLFFPGFVGLSIYAFYRVLRFQSIIRAVRFAYAEG